MKYRVTLRFYEELNDFLTREKRKHDIISEFDGYRSVKDLIESMGVPHVEVDMILVNSLSVTFDYMVQDGDRISVYPLFETFDIIGVTRLRPHPLRETRFVLDVHLGKLARDLRLLGFDVDYGKDRDDHELAEISAGRKRLLLTRARQLLMRRIVDRGLYVRNTDPVLQLREILERLDLYSQCRPFTRCIKCGGMLKSIDKEAETHLIQNVPPGVRAWCRKYHRCTGCGSVYWHGSHYEKLAKKVKEILKKEVKAP